MKCEACNGSGSVHLAPGPIANGYREKACGPCSKCGGLGHVFMCPVCKAPIARVVRTEQFARAFEERATAFEATCHGQTRSFVLTETERRTLPVYLTDAIAELVRRVEGLFAPAAEIGILPDGRKV